MSDKIRGSDWSIRTSAEVAGSVYLLTALFHGGTKRGYRNGRTRERISIFFCITDVKQILPQCKIALCCAYCLQSL